jgi:universal stress protein A
MKAKPGVRDEDRAGQIPAIAGQTEAVEGAKAWAVRHILVPVDFSACSQAALGYAEEFSRRFGARLTLLHVVEPPLHPSSYWKASVFEETNQNLLKAARERLEVFSRDYLGPSLEATHLVRMGRAYSEIPDTAKALGVDLLIIGTHGQARLAPVSLGGTTERVVRNAPCAVLTVRSPAR